MHSFSGHEAISGLFRFKVDCLAWPNRRRAQTGGRLHWPHRAGSPGRLHRRRYRPVVTGQLCNDADTPPWHGAGNHAGALAGIRSKEYAAGGFNHWVIDDTPGQLRQSTASSHADSQLNAGYLIRQEGNVCGAASTQLDTQEAHGKLKAAAPVSE